jgi:chromosome segregation ATPase
MGDIDDKEMMGLIKRVMERHGEVFQRLADYERGEAAAMSASQATIKKLEVERDNWKWEYENLCTFATQFEEQRDEARAEAERLRSDIANVEANYNQCMRAQDALRAEVERLRETLKFIASGCLVPPDGGEPRFEDAIDAAREALAGEGEK